MSTPGFAVDTSVAVPLILRTHPAHDAVTAWAADKRLCLSGHAAAETYSVMTRLPAPVRATGQDVARAMDDAFSEVLALPAKIAASVHQELASHEISGGATYDALVALAARENNMTLATRDARAQGTYETVGAVAFLLLT